MDWLRIPANLFFLTLIGLCYTILKAQVRRFGYLELYSLVWLVVIVGSQWAGPVYSPQLPTICLFYLAWLGFLLPSFVVFARTDDAFVAQSVRDPNTTRLRMALASLLLLSVAVNLNMLYRIAGNLNLFRFGWLALRIQGQSLVSENSSVIYQLFARCFVIYIPIAVLLFRRKALSRAGLASVCALALGTAAIGLTRGPILFWAVTLLISLTVLTTVSRRMWLTMLLLLSTPFVLVFSVLGYNGSQLRAVVALYGFGGIKAYEELLAGRYPRSPFDDSPFYSLDFLNYAAKKVGLITHYPSLIRSYASQPATNVYTYLDAFTLDFGVAGALLCPILLGTLAAKTHQRAYTTLHPGAIVIYAYVCYAIAMSFMNMELIRISGWLLLAEVWLVNRLISVNDSPVLAG
ncbi:MAG: oligosaccharide repeat unit polymerase [Bacteroidetes bacterium]|nr:oligosaccharide repeat unit polymerase [Fibrella sp.]